MRSMKSKSYPFWVVFYLASLVACTQVDENHNNKHLLTEGELQEQAHQEDLGKKDKVERRIVEQIEDTKKYLRRLDSSKTYMPINLEHLEDYEKDLKRIQQHLMVLNENLRHGVTQLDTQVEQQLNLTEDELDQIQLEIDEWTNKNREQ